MHPSPKEPRDLHRDGLWLVAFTFLTAAAWAALCVALYVVARLAG